MKKILYLGILCTLLLSACNDDDKEEITPSRDMQMLVVNEGINGEGGLSVVYGDGTIDVNAYEKANERILLLIQLTTNTSSRQVLLLE